MPISKAAARGITDEFSRRRGPKSGLVVGAAWGNPVLTAALEALMPSDGLTVVAEPAAAEDLRAALDAEGSWTAGNVTVVSDLAAAEPAEQVMLAAPVTVEAEAFIADIATLRKKVLPGGVLSFGATLTAPAREEIAELVAEYGIGTELIVRSFPPLRIHRLRIGSAAEGSTGPRGIAPAEELAPAWRASSVPVTPALHVDSNGIIIGGMLLGAAWLTKKVRPKSKAWLLPRPPRFPRRRSSATRSARPTCAARTTSPKRSPPPPTAGSRRSRPSSTSGSARPPARPGPSGCGSRRTCR
ncbi:hypothetical protein GCM10029992_22200 [Glycomyces albus]